jgi:hypothetical protein
MKTIVGFAILIYFFSSCANCTEEPYFNVKTLTLKNSHEILKAEEFEYFYLIADFEADNHGPYGDCSDGDKGSQEIVKDIFIITNDDFDEQYQKNDTINDIIKVCCYDCWQDEPLGTYLSQTELRLTDPRINFKFTTKPTLPRAYTFTLYIEFTNGESFRAISNPVVIK